MNIIMNAMQSSCCGEEFKLVPPSDFIGEEKSDTESHFKCLFCNKVCNIEAWDGGKKILKTLKARDGADRRKKPRKQKI